MHFQNGRWKTYDVSVLGISAVQIYRAQFQEIMSTGDFRNGEGFLYSAVTDESVRKMATKLF